MGEPDTFSLVGRIVVIVLQACAFGYVSWHQGRALRGNDWCVKSLSTDCFSPKNLFFESNVTSLKVIAPSYGQTGTTTVIEALRVLGMRAYHADDFAVFAKPVMFDGQDPTRWANTVSRCRMDAISLEPITDLLPLALSVSPNAKVIMTWRDYNSWIRSTSTGGVSKDRRTSSVMIALTNSRQITFQWIEHFDRLTGAFQRMRLEGSPLTQPPDMRAWIYRSLCNGYAWPANNVYTRGVFKAGGHEEAYLGHQDEIRRYSPPGGLLEFDVKKHGWRDIEAFLGMPPTIVDGRRLPRSRSKSSRTNDPFLDGASWQMIGAVVIFLMLHTFNYLIVATVVWLPCSLIGCLLRPFCRTRKASSVSIELPIHAPRTKAHERWDKAFNACPIVAILRGVEPDDAVALGQVLVDAGIMIVEVPLTSPRALESVARLVRNLPRHIVVGAGTVLTEQDVDAAAAAGAELVLSPNVDLRVVHATRRRGLVSVPGVATPTEAFTALQHGANALKAFPGDQLAPKVLKAWRAILPKDACLLVMGGVSTENMAEYRDAGVSGFGIGTSLFRPGDSVETVRTKAAAFMAKLPQ